MLHTEHGAIEWGTALAFLIAGCIGVRLTWQAHAVGPASYRVFYGLFAAAGLLVALEEVSYGQKVFHWRSPEWFAENNSKNETNFHNMFDSKPSDLLRSIATIGCPMLCGVLPLWLHARGVTLRPHSRPFYLLPQLQLVTMSAITIVLCIFNKIPSIRGMANWSGHLGELKELCWGIVAAAYASILSRRLSKAQPRSGKSGEPVAHEAKRQAA